MFASMRSKDRILVIKRIPYKDNLYIIDSLGEESGRRQFMLPASSTAAGKRHRALSHPMQFLQVEYVGKSKRWPRLIHLHSLWTPVHIRSDMRKTAMAYFMLENIQQLIREGEASLLFDWVYESFRRLEEEAYHPDFHLRFMVEMLDVLGIRPRQDEFGMFFDVKNGVLNRLMDVLNWKTYQLSLFYRFLEGDVLADRHERREALELAADYITFFYDHYRLPKSLNVYKEVFDEE